MIRAWLPLREIHTRKVYAVTRADLEPGMQMAQAGHALLDLAMMYRTMLADWHEQSNNLVILQVPDEAALADLAARAFEEHATHVLVREPDLDNELTAIALAPVPAAQTLTASFPLAGREMTAMT